MLHKNRENTNQTKQQTGPTTQGWALLSHCASSCVQRRPSGPTLLSAALCSVSQAIQLAQQQSRMQTMRFHHACCFDLVLTWPSSHRGLRSHKHTRRQYEDIPGMLLFDSDLLCVDGLIDADSLWRGEKGGQGREWENINQQQERKQKKNFKCQVLHSKIGNLPPDRKLPFPF